MSQHDFEIANQGFPSFRSDLNSGLQALASNSAGATEPSTTYAYQMWYDSTANLLKMRNTDNDAWITLAYFDQTNDEWEVRSAVIQAVDSAGVSIKDDSGTTLLAVADGGGVTITDNGASGGLLVQGSDTPEVAVTDTTNTVTSKLLSGNSVGNVGTTTNHDLRIVSNALTAMNVDTSQRVLMGHTSSLDDARFQISGSSSNDSSISQTRASTDSGTPSFRSYKARGSVSSPSVCVKNDQTLLIRGHGHDGTNYIRNAEIGFYVDQTPATNAMQGRIHFAVTPNGGSSCTEIARIDSDGLSFDGGSNHLDDYEEGTWTPALTTSGSAPTITYQVQDGTYTKIGRTVIVNCQLTLLSKSGGTGAVYMTGLPFAVGDILPNTSVESVGAMTFSNMAQDVSCAWPRGNHGASGIDFVWTDGGGDASAQTLNIGNIGSTWNIRMTVTYFTA